MVSEHRERHLVAANVPLASRAIRSRRRAEAHRTAIEEPLNAFDVAAMHPVAQRLSIHSATPGSNLAGCTLKHQSNRRRASRDPAFLHTTRKSAQFPSTHIFA